MMIRTTATPTPPSATSMVDRRLAFDLETPIEKPVGSLLDDILEDATPGDVLKCVSTKLPPRMFFTEGQEYEVVVNNSGDGVTIVDNLGSKVPSVTEMPDRIPLPACFEFVRKLETVPSPVPDNSTMLSNEDHDELRRWARIGVNSDLLSLEKAIADTKKEMVEVNTLTGDELNFGEMNDDDKGRLLVAQFNKERIQFKGVFGLWVDVPEGYPAILGDNSPYRIRPEGLDYLEDDLKSQQEEKKRLESLLEKFGGSEETFWF